MSAREKMFARRFISFVKGFVPVSLKCGLRHMVFYLGLSQSSKRVKKLFKENADTFKDCKEALYQMALSGRDVVTYVDSYKNKTMEHVKVLNVSLNENEPILLCAVKDDLLRIKAHVEYHRKIGIKHFAYIDNMSTDGTFEWLEKQHDISLFRTNEEYCDARQRSWMRQVTDILGYDRWYLYLDSDEFFAYPGIEDKPIGEYIDFLKEKGIISAFASMIDMYSKNSLFKSAALECDFLKEYCYFDADNYKIRRMITHQSIAGGPRARYSARKTGRNQMKYPLIKLSKSMIIGTHFNYPVELNFGTSRPIAFLLHYKFLPSDKRKYEDRVKVGNFDNGYKINMDRYRENPDATFYYEGAQKLNNTMDLLKVCTANKEFFKEFLKNDIISYCF